MDTTTTALLDTKTAISITKTAPSTAINRYRRESERLKKENEELRDQIRLLSSQIQALTDAVISNNEAKYPTVRELIEDITLCSKKFPQLRPNALKVLLSHQPEDKVTQEIVDQMVLSIKNGGCNNTQKVRLTVLGTVFKKYPVLSNAIKENNSSIKKQASEAIALTKEELELFEKVETLNSDESLVKDLFIISCYTGMRFSDVFGVTPDNITDNVLVYTSEKTKVTANVPIPKRIQNLIFDIQEFDITQYDKQVMINKMNNTLPVLCKRAWVNDASSIVFKGGERRKENRANLVSAHTGRRTAATRWARMGFSDSNIQIMMGHSSVEQTRRYIKGYIDKETVRRLTEV